MTLSSQNQTEWAEPVHAPVAPEVSTRFNRSAYHITFSPDNGLLIVMRHGLIAQMGAWELLARPHPV
jgi:hypothetical protein